MNLGHDDPLRATLTGLADLLRRHDTVPALPADTRLDGRTALVTGASSGLGQVVALELARRGARLLLPLRSGVDTVPVSIARETGNPRVEALPVDLADLDQVSALADALRERGERLDVAVLNAGLMPRRARPSAQGFEIMVAVHFLANRLLLHRWLNDGVLPPARAPGEHVPRVVLVASDAHRSAPRVEWERLGAMVDYGLRGGMAHYAHSKLLVMTLAQALAARLRDDGRPTVAVHALCPGAVASRIGREAPALVRPLLDAVMRVGFASPAKAAVPVLTLAAAPHLEGRTGLYYHLLREAEPAALALDPVEQRAMWETSAALLAPWLAR